MKKIGIIILSMVLCLCLAFPTFASETDIGTMKNFKVQNTYKDGVYTDLKTGEWYIENVKKCYELALMLGNGDGKFNPEGNVTVAEALTMACRVNNIFIGGTGAMDTSVGTNWYDGVVDYAIKKEIITAGEYTAFDIPATRTQLAKIFAKALPLAEYDVINEVKKIPDMKVTDAGYNEILMLYNAGIVIGSDEKGNFLPRTNITRAEAATIICRVADKESRILIIEEEDKKPSIGEDTGSTGNAPNYPGYEDEIPEDEDINVDIDDEFLGEEVLEEEPPVDLGDTAWSGSLVSNEGGVLAYYADYKSGSDVINFTIMKEVTGQLDMSKMMFGQAQVDWATEQMGFSGEKVSLTGTYRKCEKDSEVVNPGDYSMKNGTLYGNTTTIIKLKLSVEDSTKIKELDGFNNIGDSVSRVFVMAMEEGWYTGSEDMYMIIDAVANKVSINSFDESVDVYYLVTNIEGYNDAYYNTTGDNMEIAWLLEDYILVSPFCDSVTFCNDEGVEVKSIYITQEILNNGLDFAQIVA